MDAPSRPTFCTLRLLSWVGRKVHHLLSAEILFRLSQPPPCGQGQNRVPHHPSAFFGRDEIHIRCAERRCNERCYRCPRFCFLDGADSHAGMARYYLTLSREATPRSQIFSVHKSSICCSGNKNPLLFRKRADHQIVADSITIKLQKQTAHNATTHPRLHLLQISVCSLPTW